MHKALLFPYLLLLFSLTVKAQNLVPDPGFEIFTEDCEGNLALEHWFNPNIATPDLFCVEGCGNILTAEVIQIAEVPAIPDAGSCYAGLYCALSSASNTQSRDYLSTELTTPLQNGEFYRVSFSLARRTLSNYAVDRIGIYFSDIAPLSETGVVMDVEPQLETQGTLLTPELEWMSIEFNYIADGTERFLTVGNFREPEEMMLVDMGTSHKNWDVAYYLFDSFVVEPSTGIAALSDDVRVRVGQEFILVSVQTETEISIVDLSGRIIVQQTLSPGEFQLPIVELASGIYVFRAYNRSGTFNKKFWKE